MITLALLVPDETVDQHAVGVAEVADPEAASQIRELQELRAAHAGLAGVVKAELRNLAPGRIETDDPIKVVAAGAGD